MLRNAHAKKQRHNACWLDNQAEQTWKSAVVFSNQKKRTETRTAATPREYGQQCRKRWQAYQAVGGEGKVVGVSQ
jgi:hypothetical protein